MKSLFRYFTKSSFTTLTINNPYGLHLRPSTLVVNSAKKFSSAIEIHHKTKIADAKNLHKLLGLNIAFGDTITIKAFGKDSTKAILELESILKNNKDDYSTTENTTKHIYSGLTIQGVAISDGVGLGDIWYMPISQNFISNETFSQTKNRILGELSKNTNPIFQAHYELVKSLEATNLEELKQEIKSHIQTIESGANHSKIDDYQDILHRFTILKAEPTYPKQATILVAKKLLPSDIEAIANASIQGVIITSDTAPNSHVALLLRSYQIPAICIQQEEIKDLQNKTIIIDGSSGTIATSLSDENLAYVSSYKEGKDKLQEVAFKNRLLDAITKNGKKIEVLANIHNLQSANEAKEYGANKIGLLRSEFIFKEDKPTLQEQINFYQEIFELFEEVTVRTLDVGGDKQLPYITIPNEQNPFLGIRGIRLLKTHREIISEQLEAILIASKGKKVKIMFPMVATVDEFLDGKNLAIELSKKLNIDYSNISFGIMIEIPCVIFMLSQFNEVVDFYSIGTNDLHQYLFAVDRTHTSFRIEDDWLMFEVISQIVKQATKPVSICGEIASEIDKIDKLLGSQINSLSVTPKMVPIIKSEIREI